jgi:hypothetical protein
MPNPFPSADGNGLGPAGAHSTGIGGMNSEGAKTRRRAKRWGDRMRNQRALHFGSIAPAGDEELPDDGRFALVDRDPEAGGRPDFRRAQTGRAAANHGELGVGGQGG